ncbi:MAG: dienelactone hydrolase [Acidimicrobiia bacterium]|nr:dienelactone hydrolase [Acidimicrobiia bacterium]MDX2465856.1 dienelactone hydrolase [Acidimicrobiia bacterium]
MARRLVVKWGEGEKVTARLAIPKHSRGAGVLLAHGAGAGQDHPFMVELRDALAAQGLITMTFNYAYTEAGRRAPDRLPKLLAVHRAAADRLATYCDEVILGGKSMGGRVGSHLAGDEGWGATGLVYYGYPLVPLGKPEPRDTTHLLKIRVPQLFLAGSRDRLSPADLIVPLVAGLIEARAEIIEGGDHSFKVPKKLERDQDEVIAELAALTADWLG